MCSKPWDVEEAQQLELRALAVLEAPVGLEDHLLAEHDRAVRLLAADRPHRRERGRVGQRAGERELDASRQAVASGCPRRSAASSACGERRVGQPRARSRRARRGASAAGTARRRRRRTRPRRAPARSPGRARRSRPRGRRRALRDLDAEPALLARRARPARRRRSQLDVQQVSLLQARLEAHVVAPDAPGEGARRRAGR